MMCRFKSCSGHKCEVSGHRSHFVPGLFFVFCRFIAGHRSLFRCDISGHRSLFPPGFGLVVTGFIYVVFGNDFAGVAVDDHRVRAVGQDDDRCSCMCSTDSEVFEFAGIAESDSS